jgi:diguanylate cyclase (GGDEF)-like protein/PAS domain S-box-containing protein
MAEVRNRRVLARLFKEPGEVVGTGVAFALLHWWGVLGNVPLWALLGILLVSGLLSTVIDHVFGRATSTAGLHARMALSAANTGAVIYATGWGPMLAIGYVVIVAGELNTAGSAAVVPSMVWCGVVMAAGELAIALHVAPTVVSQPLVHGLGAMSALGLMFVIRLLGTKTAQVEHAQASLGRSEERFRSLVQNSSDVVLVANAEGAVSYMSGSGERMMGWQAEKVIGERVHQDAVHPKDLPEARRLFLDVLAEPRGSRTFEARVRDARGSWRWLEITWTNLLEEPSVEGIVANLRDVTERKAAEASLAHQALHDPLTDIPNRVLFTDRLDHALARPRRVSNLAVLHIDIDRFKLVNDSLGHPAGDTVLLAVTDVLRNSLRPGDTLARLGGDEFAVCCEDLPSPEQAITLAARIQERLRGPFEVEHQDVYVTVSIGIVLARADGETTADAMLRDADAALHRAKERGRDRFELFDEEMRTRAVRRLTLESELRRAIEREELEVFYQPVVALQSGTVTGVEALARWRHPERGFIPPNEFVPLAEEAGVIGKLDELVLRAACREAAAWDAGPVQFAVNVSGRHLEEAGFPEKVGALLAEAGLDPALLCLEITESVLLGDAPRIRRQLARLDDLGVEIAVDDFGTGYSSLRYLKRFPVHVLKVDQSFVAEMHRAPRDAAIVQAVIALAHALDLTVIAEGVETADQLASLRGLGCERGQGFHWSEPVCAAEIREFLRRHLVPLEAV